MHAPAQSANAPAKRARPESPEAPRQEDPFARHAPPGYALVRQIAEPVNWLTALLQMAALYRRSAWTALKLVPGHYELQRGPPTYRPYGWMAFAPTARKEEVPC